MSFSFPYDKNATTNPIIATASILPEMYNAFFHSNSGGATESPINVWGGSNYPYLQTVTTAGEDAYKQYKSSVSVTKKEFEEKIKKLHSDFKIDFKQKDCIKIEEYTEGRKS